jgi:hypothetical protein
VIIGLSSAQHLAMFNMQKRNSSIGVGDDYWDWTSSNNTGVAQRMDTWVYRIMYKDTYLCVGFDAMNILVNNNN